MRGEAYVVVLVFGALQAILLVIEARPASSYQPHLDPTQIQSSLLKRHTMIQAVNRLHTIEHSIRQSNLFSSSPNRDSDKMSRSKKGSVSWLLATAIRMCKKYPAHCLRGQRAVGVNADQSLQHKIHNQQAHPNP